MAVINHLFHPGSRRY